MKRYYFTVLFFMFAALPFVQATNVKIEPLKESTYNDWEPTYDKPLTFLVSVTGIESSGEISFSFTQVSSWPGFYMNKDSDIEIENSRPDLRFYASGQSKDAYANVEKAREGEKQKSTETFQYLRQITENKRTRKRATEYLKGIKEGYKFGIFGLTPQTTGEGNTPDE